MGRWTFVLLCLLMAVPAQALELVDRIVAVVNKEPILLSELEETLEMVEDFELRGMTAEERAQRKTELERELVDLLIGQELMEQAMDEGDLQVTDRDVEMALADIARSNGLTVERLWEEVTKQGLDEASYRADLKKQVRQQRFIQMNIMPRIDVSEEDVRNRWNLARQGEVTGTSWRLERLMLKWAGEGDADKQAIRDEGAALLRSLEQGSPFGELAKARSDDSTTKENGGDAGLFQPADLSPAFRDALSAVAVGSAVLVETAVGMFVLRVAEEVDTSEAEFEKGRFEIMRKLESEAMEREIELWTAERRRKAHVEILF
jgi:peptidyl-prolyl cis-trans isomerase SurA